MMRKDEVKRGYKGQPKQFYWEESLKLPFEKLIQNYDPDLSTNNAIKKLIRWAISEAWLPGYERKGKPVTKEIISGIAKDLSNLSKKLVAKEKPIDTEE